MQIRQTIALLCALALQFAPPCFAAVNSPPTANPDSYTVNEDTTLSIATPGVLTNDVDPEGNSMTALLVTGPTKGALTLNGTGSFTYRPATNFNGTDTFIYKTRDSSGTSAPVSVTITVNAINDTPRATNNAYSTASDTTLIINAPGVIANDGDVDGDPLTAVLVTNVTRGSLALAANGSFTYTPQANYAGNDSFAYRASDGTTTSAVAVVTISVVPAAIVVITPPANQTGCIGDSVTFSVTATGTALSYQWYKSSTAMTGRTNSSLTLTNLVSADAGTYRVRMTGATNSVTNSATLTMNVPVTATPLTNTVRSVGAPVAFRTSASGTGPFTFTWLKDSNVIPSQTSSNLLLTNLVAADSGTYSVIVSDPCRSVTNSASLLVAPCFSKFDVMLVIDRSGSMLGQPYTDARSACTNFVFNLRLHATNDQIGLASFNPTGTLNQVLTTNGASMLQKISALPEAAKGTCISCGLLEGQEELESARHRNDALPVLVLLSDGLPHDFDTPSNALYNAEQIKLAGTRIFTVGLGSGTDPVLMSQMASSSNDYFYANDSSELAGLFDQISEVICRPPTNIFGPFDVTACAGTNIELRVNATGCASFAFQWRKDGTPLTGATNNVLTLTNVHGTNSGIYSVIINGSCRKVTNAAVVTVNEPVLVVTPPQNQFSYIGSNATFSVSATGTGLSYAWRFNGSLIGTNSTLALNQLSAAHAGTYCVSINGSACGGATNVCATLTLINRAPFATNDAYSTDEDVPLTISIGSGVLANDFDLDGDVLSAVLVAPPSHGAVTLNPGGSFTYSPALNFNGTDTFTYRANDGSAESDLAVVTVVVQPQNDTPVAAGDDQYTTAEDTLLSVSLGAGVLANDIDVDGDPLSTVLVTTTTNGTLALQANGSFAYLPNTHFNGVDHFQYRATDGIATSGIALVKITVTPVNDVPIAQDDSYSTDEDVVLVIAAPGILANDTDADGEVLTPSLITTPTNGTVVLNVSDGSFTYRPSTNTHGVDHFTYQVSDGKTNSGIATVTITINSINDTPVAANDDQYVTAEDTALQVSAVNGVLANDIDVDGNALNALLASGTTNGVLTLASNGSFLYLPGTNFHGIDHFTYRATDGLATSSVAVVTIAVTTVNDAPIARDDSYTTDEDVKLIINTPGVLANDSDNDADILSAVLVSTTVNGTLALNESGSFTYTPNTNFHGTDSFSYRANDGQTNSGVAVVTITVRSINDTPVAANDDQYATAEDIVLNVFVAAGVLNNDIDVDGDELTTVLASSPTNGILTLNANGSFVYRPNTNFHGIDRFTYRATDGVATSAVAVVTIAVTPINDVPIARDDNYFTDEDIVLVVNAPGVLINDSDIDGDALSAVLITQPARGTLTLNANGSFTYTPSTNLHGVDSFTYRANDGQTSSAIATVTITVRSINDTPVAASDDQYVTLEDTLLTVAADRGVLTNDNDVDGDTLSTVLVNTTTNGVLALQTNGSFTYLPNTNFNGIDHFTYRATDGTATSALALVTIAVISTNDVPVARDDAYATDEDVPLLIGAPGVLANDSDNDGDVLSAVVVTPAANGSLILNANGSFTYTPATNFNGIDSFTYRARDPLTNSGVAVVTITVRSVNDTPVAANDDQYTTAEDTLLTIAGAAGVLANDIDVDGDVLRAMVVSTATNGTLTLQTNGSFQYLPNTNFNGLDYFTYRATDGIATSSVAVVKITVTPVNDVPVARDDSYATDEDVQLVIAAPGLLTNDSDADGDTLTPAVLTTTTNGTLTLNANGSFTYTPATNFHGSDSFRYRVSDGKTNSGMATVSLTIRSVNDTPVAANDDQFSTLEDTLLTVTAANGILINDVDVDGDSLKALLVSSTTNGTLVLQTNGAFTYLPNTNFHGVDHFTYRATDGQATSSLAVVTINVASVNDVPVARNDSFTTDEDVALVIAVPGILGNDSDNDGDTLTTVLVNTSTNGMLILNANGSFTYRPATNFHGTDAFTYRASDGITNSAVAIVNITINSINDTPVAANDDQYSTREDTLLIVPAISGVLSNDLDVDGDILSAVLVNTTTNGALVLQPNGAFTYLPSTNFFGVDHFTYRATDGAATSTLAVVTISVVSVNDGPVARDDSYTTDEDILLAVSAPGVLGNDADQDGDTLTTVVVTTTSSGTLTLNANGSFTYLPLTNFHGTDVFTYRATDGQTNSSIATVTITVRSVNDRPYSRDDGGENFTVLEDQVLTIAAPGILANDSDEDGDVLTAELRTPPSNGTLALNANGSFSYTPALDYFGTDSFTYVAKDATTSSAPSTVTIIVRPVNDAPSFVKGASQRVNYDVAAQTVANWATKIKAGPTNEAAQTLNFVVSNNNTSLFSAQPAISTSGTLTYTPVGNNFGVATVTVALKDDGGTANGGVDTSTQQTFTITLNGPPTVNIVSPSNGTVLVGTNNITVVAEASDPDSALTNVQIFFGTNVWDSFTNGPFLSFFSNLPPRMAPYTFYAVAADDLNLRATSSVVSVIVTASPPVSAVGPIALNRQNGLFEQYVRISNPTPRGFPNGMRLFIAIDTTNRVYNATGTNGPGMYYIDALQSLPSGTHIDVLVQYYLPDTRSVPNPILRAEPLPFTIPSTPAPQLAYGRTADGRLVLQFGAATNRLYYIQSTTNFSEWKTYPGLISGPGAVQWTNQPAITHEFYRALLLPY